MISSLHSTVRNCAAIVLLLACGAWLTGCDDDSDPSAPETPSPSPTPAWSTPTPDPDRVYEFYLGAESDGLFCFGRRDHGSETIYTEPQLWIALPLSLGEQFQSYMFWATSPAAFTVLDVDIELETGAGLLDDVIRFGHHIDASFGRYYYLKPGLGLVGEYLNSGRGHSSMKLVSCAVAPGVDPLSDVFGLNVGNQWILEMDGNDTNGYPYGGHEYRTVLGRRYIHGKETYILQLRNETWHHYPWSAQEQPQKLKPPDMLRRAE